MLQEWVDALMLSLYGAWNGFVVGYLPNVVGAIIVLIVGLIVASGLKQLVMRLVEVMHFDAALLKLGIGEYVERAGLKVNSGKLLGGLVYWFILIAFLLAVSDILKFGTFSEFLRGVLIYIPQVIVAVLIMLAAVVVANFLRGAVVAAVMSAKMHAPNFLGSLTWWAVVIFGFLAALTQLGIAVQIINTLITGLIAMLALAGGIAFGLGGRDTAEEVLKGLKRELEGR